MTESFGQWFAPAQPRACKSRDDLHLSLTKLAQLGVAAASGAVCLIVWRNFDRQGLARASTDSRWDSISNALLSSLNRQLFNLEPSAQPILRLSTPEVASLCGNGIPFEERLEAVGVHSTVDSSDVTVLMLAPSSGRPAAELKALLDLLAGTALFVILSAAEASSVKFWRKRATVTAQALAKARSELSHAVTEQRRIESAVERAIELRSGNRFARLGSLVASIGPFAAWIVAIEHDGLLEIAAASPAIPASLKLDPPSALAESFRRGATILRSPAAGHARTFHEDRLFARFPSYLCVPFEAGAFALVAHKTIDSGTRARAEGLIARLNLLIRSWRAGAEVEGLRSLVRNLGLRMFAAIDAERARIARDLHDDQAQLLAAARIALEAGGEQARGIFKQLEEELRARARELRPATLGRSSLEDALRVEIRRLTEAGIKARLVRAGSVDRLPRSIQQVCYQVAREAFSNVIRHSKASRVEVSLGRSKGRARLRITDNGCGIPEGAHTDGIGLGGIKERLELLGGTIRVESQAGSTKVIAEIPEAV